MTGDYPSLAQVTGHALSAIFLDTLAMDIDQLERVNHTRSTVAPERRLDICRFFHWHDTAPDLR
ncbi:MAG: hypothetical protein IPG98_12010 [Burkholderiales bacterium]|nr:hypothetical protein [Burkholderiales bacterium]MBK8664964.1 hypothetical protein [Burkholderiales bacterium]